MTESPEVFGWLADRAGCGTLRMIHPLEALADTGTRIRYHERAQPADWQARTFIGQRVCKAAPTKLWQEWAAKPTRPKMVFEVDDDLWNVDHRNEVAYRFFMQGVDNKGRFHGDIGSNLIKNAQVADVVTTTTESLAEVMRKYNPNVTVVPNYIRRWVLSHERPQRDRVTVGWHGSASHAMDWDEAGPQLQRYLLRNPQVQFHSIGVQHYATGLKVPLDQLRATPWVEGVEPLWRTIDFDIGLAPLLPHIFNRSKSHLKYLEYAALGIPTIASDCGPYSDSIKHGVTGFLVKRDHEWGKYLRALVEDEELREGMGRNAKAWAQTQILEDHVGEWVEALR